MTLFQQLKQIFTLQYWFPNRRTAEYTIQTRCKMCPTAHEDTKKKCDNFTTVEDFKYIQLIGKGGFGKVMLVSIKNETAQVFAMKVIQKEKIYKHKMTQHINNEFKIWSTIQHPFICCLHYAFQCDVNLYLVSEYHCGGSLHYHLNTLAYFSEARACFYLSEIILALTYLHTNKILYRDLKMENIIMNRSGHVALTDFGLSKTCLIKTRTFCGTLEYMAPEMIRRVAYGFSIDWWSFGILMYEMMCKKTPFRHENRDVTCYSILNETPKFPTHLSRASRSLIILLLNKDPKIRLKKIMQIKKHRFFKHVDFKQILNKQTIPPFRPDIDYNEVKYISKQLLKKSVSIEEDDDDDDDIVSFSHVFKHDFQYFYYKK